MSQLQLVRRSFWPGFWQLADPKIWVASTVPMLVGAALAYARTGTIDLPWFALALAGIYLIEIGKNAVNEFVDFLCDVDTNIGPDKRNPFSGGKKTIVDGKLSVLDTALIAAVTLAAAFFIGAAIAWFREPNVFWIGMIGGVLAVFYSVPPFKLNYNGLGEAAVGISFGPLMTLGMYVMLTGELDWEAAAVGVPLAFLIANVLWINQYPDYEADMIGGKRNWLVRIGKRRGIRIYAGLFACAFVSVAVLAAVLQNPWWLLALAGVPVAWNAVRTASASIDRLPEFLKANAATVLIYQLTGAAIVAAVLLG